MRRKFLLAIAMIAFSTPAFADASTFCMYALLLEAHLQVVHCGNPLDAAREKLYQQEIAAIRANLIADSHQAGNTPAQRETSIDGYEARLRASYQSDDQSLCKSKDYSSARELLNNILNAKVLSRIQADLKAHKDPEKGDCL